MTDLLMLPIRDFSLSKFALPRNGERSSSWCGEPRLRMCDNVKEHLDSSLDGASGAGKYVVEVYRASCGKISCPICYEKAIGKMAIRVEWAFSHFKARKYVKHVVVSVPERLYHLGAKKLRTLAISALKAPGVHGGCVIYHPWREKCASCGSGMTKINGVKICVECGASASVWLYMPHFHCLGVGKVIGIKVKNQFECSGWVVVNLGAREHVRATVLYQLSHCGVAEGFSNIVWFGSMSCSKRKCPPLPPEKHECPLCGQKMRKPLLDPWMVRLMKSNLMDDVEEGIYFADPEMFEHWDPWDGEGG